MLFVLIMAPPAIEQDILLAWCSLCVLVALAGDSYPHCTINPAESGFG